MEGTPRGPDLELRQLLPEQRTVSVAHLLTALDPTQYEGGDRPHTLVNFVATVDGRTSFLGRSGPIGDEGDRQMFHGLRERVDAVMAGTATLRTERYGRLARDPERRGRRIDRGLPPEPLAVVITRSGDVPLDIPLFAEPEARVVMFTPTELDTSSCAAQVEVVMLEAGQMTMTTAWRRLTSDFGVRTLLCEGGATVFGALLQEDLVDELFLTVSPRLAGGGSETPITSGPPLPELLHLTLLWALEREGSLFLRYAVSR
ncbi:MAG TPA: dihydrofolate reductase family protein [Solirubrobacteraceae bacterium]|nr:dihydrofolate reductase family protein [Solirubrobacteraceae bacterium]